MRNFAMLCMTPWKLKFPACFKPCTLSAILQICMHLAEGSIPRDCFA